MSDLIDREYAIKRFCEDGTYLERHGVTMMTLCEAKQRAVDLIESFPTAQLEHKTGQLLYHHTENIDEEKTADVYFCSSCKKEVLKKIRFGMFGGELDMQYDYCPLCGADMRDENDE